MPSLSLADRHQAIGIGMPVPGGCAMIVEIQMHLYLPRPREPDRQASCVRRSPALYLILPAYCSHSTNQIAFSIHVASSVLLATILIARHLEAQSRLLTIAAPSCSHSGATGGQRRIIRRRIMLSHISLCAPSYW
jgi:hypothetical protein